MVNIAGLLYRLVRVSCSCYTLARVQSPKIVEVMVVSIWNFKSFILESSCKRGDWESTGTTLHVVTATALFRLFPSGLLPPAVAPTNHLPPSKPMHPLLTHQLLCPLLLFCIHTSPLWICVDARATSLDFPPHAAKNCSGVFAYYFKYL